MKIGFVTERMILGFGVDLVIHQLASGLSRRGHRVTVYTPRSDGTYEGQGYTIRHVPVEATSAVREYELRATAAAHVILEGNEDVLVLCTFPFFALAPRLAPFLPCLAMDHGVVPADGVPFYLRRAFARVARSQYRDHLPHVSQVVTVSNFLRDGFPAHIRDKTAVIYNGVDHYPIPSPEEVTAFRRRLGIGERDVMWLYVGRINPRAQPYKGTSELVALYRRLSRTNPAIRLVMAGFGDEQDARWLRKAGVIPCISAPPGEMPLLFGAADLYVTASRWEGFDLPLVEAQRFGRPVVAYRIGAHPEVVRAGETGFLVDDSRAFEEAVGRLTVDAAMRREMGAKASAWAAGFCWNRSVGRFEEMLIETQLKVTDAGADEPPPKVSAIVINYNAEKEHLDLCLGSLLAQSYPCLEIMLVDNGSANDSVEYVEGSYPKVRVLRLGKNLGFAAGVNRGVNAATGEYVLILNFDVKLAPDAVKRMARAIRSDSRLAGVAPKTLLYHHPGIIDNIGNLLDSRLNAFNMGIGQLDIGQYDRPEQVMGACFAVALLRRDAFREDRVGPLDETFFLYYEDVEWCYRANIFGFKFMTVPDAVAYHVHSVATRRQPYAFKYELINLNLLRTLAQNFESTRQMGKLMLRRLADLTRNVLVRRYARASLKVLVRFFREIPYRFRKRRQIRARRLVPDHYILRLSQGETPFFDPVGYRPQYTIENLQAMYRRKFLVTGEPRYRQIARFLENYREDYRLSKLCFEPQISRKTLLRVLEGEPPDVQEFVNRLGR